MRDSALDELALFGVGERADQLVFRLSGPGDDEFDQAFEEGPLVGASGGYAARRPAGGVPDTKTVSAAARGRRIPQALDSPRA